MIDERTAAKLTAQENLSLPSVQNTPPAIGTRVVLWYAHSQYLGWQNVSSAKTFARKHRGGSSRNHIVWVPADGIDTSRGVTFEQMVLVGFIHTIDDSQLTTSEEAYKEVIIAESQAPYRDFSSALLYKDPEHRYDELRAKYEAEVKAFKEECTKKYIALL